MYWISLAYFMSSCTLFIQMDLRPSLWRDIKSFILTCLKNWQLNGQRERKDGRWSDNNYNGVSHLSECLQDIKGQSWTDEESDGENESEQFLYGIQVPRPSWPPPSPPIPPRGQIGQNVIMTSFQPVLPARLFGPIQSESSLGLFRTPYYIKSYVTYTIC